MSNTVSLPGNVSLDGPRGRTYASILETVGSTPLVAAPKFAEAEGIKANLLFKCEFFNPLASVKDRIGLNMVLQLESDGKLKPGGVLVEPTSGNTGIGLAFAAASRGYRLILTMPESMSIERRKMLAYLGAELVLTPKEKGMGGAIAKAKEILEATPGAVMPSQFDNPANPAIHELTTAEEIWADTDGAVDAVLSGIGTGGTFTGTGRVLKARKPDLKMMAIEPEGSPVLSGGEPGPHMIQGIGAGFVPENLHTQAIDGAIQVDPEDAKEMARRAASEEGMLVGISSGATLAAIAKKLPDLPEGSRVLGFNYDTGERYLSVPDFLPE